MKLTYVALFRWLPGDKEPIMLGCAADLSEYSFFQRGTIKEGMTFTGKTVTINDFQALGISGWEDTQVDLTAGQPLCEQALIKYKDPAQADKLTRVQQELDKTKAIMHQTIESVLDRGEKLDDLVNKSLVMN
eukprot:jgi/Ulvmu1/5929/UM026_0051.1